MHSPEHAAMHGLEAVAHVWQGATDDDGHGVIQIGAPHLVFNIYIISLRSSFHSTDLSGTIRAARGVLVHPKSDKLARASLRLPRRGSDARQPHRNYLAFRGVKYLDFRAS